MKVKIYINWEDKDILSEADYDKKFETNVTNLMKDEFDFLEWLGGNYSLEEILKATDVDRLRICNDWEECCKETERYNSDYEEVEIEI